ncbi:hypothetical protein [Arenicella xantha]|uniref:hypothetical protein n=1 Tax=Arenicella xantha TaxID=644221 RepID=UPI0014752506|nr:hypothetical protein [Arenicella xantha]
MSAEFLNKAESSNVVGGGLPFDIVLGLIQIKRLKAKSATIVFNASLRRRYDCVIANELGQLNDIKAPRSTAFAVYRTLYATGNWCILAMVDAWV